MGLRPASGGVRSRAELAKRASMQVEQIPPALTPARFARLDYSALF